MKLTKEQINSIRHVVTCDDLHLTECASEELRRLALLGLESEQEADALRLRAQRRDAAESDAINAAFGAFPDLEPDDEPKRDERAERVGRAVLVAGDTARFALDVAIDHIRNGIGFEDDEIPKLRAIADAMEDAP